MESEHYTKLSILAGIIETLCARPSKESEEVKLLVIKKMKELLSK